tara:strand:- start:3029 stop:4081 length:1053 start_codon:yes stop_codon:yes gene_type:complete
MSWIVTRYDDVDIVLRNPKIFSNERSSYDTPRSLLTLDPPDHTRLRSLVSQAFTPASVHALSERMDDIVSEILAELDFSRPFDVIESIAYPLPIIVISELLGVRPDDRQSFARWSADIARSIEPTISRNEAHRVEQSRDALNQYFSNVIEERRRQPEEDLISRLVQAEEGGEKLSLEEMLSLLRLLLIAGNETTKNLIGNGLLALLCNPGELERLRSEPSLMESAVEEMLRFDSPVQVDLRTVGENTVVGGTEMSCGQRVLAVIGAANRDPEAFPDPNTLDLSRNDRPNMSFGRGIHHCLGAPLARLEAAAAFKGMIHGLKEISLEKAPRFRSQLVLRGVESLIVKANGF